MTDTAALRVLVADDDRMATTMLRAAIKEWRFDVTVVHDGEAAWAAMLSEHPQIAVLDWEMPGADGPELCRRARENPETAGAYIILLTGRDGRANLIHGLGAGADDYVTKPFDRDEFRVRVQVGARVAALQQRLAERVTELEAALANVRQLEGFIAICSYCKRIRSDAQQWEQMERYISDHSHAQFSHGICPDCFEQVRKEFGV